MKKSVMGFVITVGMMAIAQTNVVQNAEVDPEAIVRRIYEEKLGGFVTKPGSKQGAVRIVNIQAKLPSAEIEAVVKTIKTQMEHDVAVVPGKPLSSKLPTAADVKAANATLALFVVDDDSLPTMLYAAEERWALANVAKLSEGLKDDAAGKRFFARRARGEILRAFSLLCGGGISMFAGNLFGVTSVSQLDTVATDGMVVDMVPRYEKYLQAVGVTPAYTIPYAQAYQEGWAPAPTNKFQRAVIEEIKAERAKEPTKGIKIKYDSKRNPAAGGAGR